MAENIADKIATEIWDYAESVDFGRGPAMMAQKDIEQIVARGMASLSAQLAEANRCIETHICAIDCLEEELAEANARGEAAEICKRYCEALGVKDIRAYINGLRAGYEFEVERIKAERDRLKAALKGSVVQLLYKLNGIAGAYDREAYGLPLANNERIQQMVDAVSVWIEAALAAAPEQHESEVK